MLKIYKVHTYVSVDGADWREVGRSGYKITDEEIYDHIVLEQASFSETLEYLSHKIVNGVWDDVTFFRHKPIICVHYSNADDPIYYRKFDTMSYKIVYVEWRNVSMKWLMEHLTADQFTQYLKERGITTCQMNF